MIYIFMSLYNIRLRVIGFPLNLWVGSYGRGLRIGTQTPTSYFLANFKECFTLNIDKKPILIKETDIN